MNETLIEVVNVDFPAQLPKTLFRPPTPQLDAVFPAGRTSITLPLALLENRWVLVQASLSGRLGTFVLDTGTESTVYDFAYLKKVGAQPKGEIAPAGGLFKGISFVRTETMEFGELRFGAQTVIATDLHAPDSPLPTQLDGILGYDFLSRFPFTIDYVGGWLTFWKPGSYQPVAQELRVPLEFDGTSIRVPVRINGKEAGPFQIDTGNGGFCLVQHTKLPHLLDPRNGNGQVLFYEHGQEFGTGSASAYVTHADLTVGIGAKSVTWKSAPVRVLNLDDPHASSVGGFGNIGYSWLSHFRITFDYGNSKIYLLQRQSFRPSSLSGDYGLEMRPVKGKLVVRDVAANTPASSAGLRSGDELMEVDGIPVLLLNNQAPRLLSSPIPGEAHTAIFRRGKEVVTLQLIAIPIP
jgi:PDZ domain/Aspartyl protease